MVATDTGWSEPVAITVPSSREGMATAQTVREYRHPLQPRRNQSRAYHPRPQAAYATSPIPLRPQVANAAIPASFPQASLNQPARKHNKGICNKFLTTGTCAYGERCKFVHARRVECKGITVAESKEDGVRVRYNQVTSPEISVPLGANRANQPMPSVESIEHALELNRLVIEHIGRKPVCYMCQHDCQTESELGKAYAVKLAYFG